MTDLPGGSVPALVMDDVEFAYAGSRPGMFSFHVEHFRIGNSERVLLVGPSGCGKSTLLNLVCGTLSAGRGRIEVLGTDLQSLTGAARDRFRARNLGVIFQQFNLLPYCNVLENVLLPSRIVPDVTKDVERRAQELLEALDLGRDLWAQKGATLSIGQQQRVAVARAFLLRPRLVIADEPTSALDSDRRDSFMQLLFSQAEETGAAVLVVSHDDTARHSFDRVVHMSEITTRNRSAA